MKLFKSTQTQRETYVNDEVCHDPLTEKLETFLKRNPRVLCIVHVFKMIFMDNDSVSAATGDRRVSDSSRRSTEDVKKLADPTYLSRLYNKTITLLSVRWGPNSFQTQN